MLTDGEIISMYDAACYKYMTQDARALELVRTAIAAYNAKLLAGVEMPAPDTHCWDDDTQQDCWSHSKDQLQQYAAAAASQAREKALDEAKGVCTELQKAWFASTTGADACGECTNAIEQLKVKSVVAQMGGE